MQETPAQAAGATEAEPGRPRRPFGTKETLIVAFACGTTTMSFNVWYPFMPLYVLKLGATSDANALFWVAVATAVQGVGRLLTGPVWGVFSDRFGRKVMLLRALYLSTMSFAVMAIITAPWQVAIALGLQGVFSGHQPPSVALVSVSVPDSKINTALGYLSGATYIGSTVGPALGAGLAIALGYRGAILGASLIPLVAATLVLFFVPSDEVGGLKTETQTTRPQLEPFRLTYQFLLCIFLFFVIYAVGQLIRFATPIALRAIEGDKDVAGIAGLTFTLGGLASAFSVLVLAPRFFRVGRLRLGVAAGCVLAAVGFVFIAFAGSTAVYVVGFIIVSLIVSALVPTTNTLVAANVPRSRRGTGFGVVGSAQAMGFTVGPAAAALFAAISLEAGFALVAVFLVGLAALIVITLREPNLDGGEIHSRV